MDATFALLVNALRNADIRVSTAETLDAFAVLSHVGIRDKTLLRDALELTLAKTVDEKERFDETFERFFDQLAFRVPAKRAMLRDVDREEIIETLRTTTSTDVVDTVESALDNDRDRLAMLVQQAASRLNLGSIRTLREKSYYVDRIAEALSVRELDDYVGSTENADPAVRYLRQYLRQEIRDYVDSQYRLRVDATGKRALLDAALNANLDRIPFEYQHEVRRVVEKLADRLVRDHRRRLRKATRGVIDIKKTLRRNVAYDGTMFDVRWRRHKREKTTVYVLCDVSSSVARVARFLLLFLYELTDVLPNLRAFTFSSRLGEVTDIFRSKASDEAIEDALFFWGKGNTDYARALIDFRERCGTDLNSRSVLVVLGDGRNNYYDARADILRELSNRVKQVFWLTPETPDTWGEGDSEMPRYAPHCFRVATCNRIEHIERFAENLLTATR
ncbi:MAG: hypothetical protein CM1200mP9_12390 [Gammaproteobacteria bacterium]|nr:VWA domain-containing protein [Pseudomonadales bacterium]GIS70418.1 MAG: hypothetical protein CM1200mP9_12390 [Gammaproteobacteria bacterium]